MPKIAKQLSDLAAAGRAKGRSEQAPTRAPAPAAGSAALEESDIPF